MKKVFAVVLVLGLAIGFAAHSGKPIAADPPPTPNSYKV